jgi:hypothetical protein
MLRTYRFLRSASPCLVGHQSVTTDVRAARNRHGKSSAGQNWVYPHGFRVNGKIALRQQRKRRQKAVI